MRFGIRRPHDEAQRTGSPRSFEWTGHPVPRPRSGPEAVRSSKVRARRYLHLAAARSGPTARAVLLHVGVGSPMYHPGDDSMENWTNRVGCEVAGRNAAPKRGTPTSTTDRGKRTNRWSRRTRRTRLGSRKFASELEPSRAACRALGGSSFSSRCALRSPSVRCASRSGRIVPRPIQRPRTLLPRGVPSARPR